MTHNFVAEAGAAAERLDVYLASRLKVSRSQAARLIHDQAVLVGGQPERSSYLVQPGDRISIDAPEAEPVPYPTIDLPIVYEDTDIIVVNKPAGIASHTGAGQPPDAATVADFARPHTTDPDPERPGIVHRLDRDTSGLMIIAKSPEAKAFMQDAFRQHQVHKTYHLLATGRVEPAEAVINLPLDRDPARPLRRAVVAGGRAAVTRYRTTGNYPGYSLIEARPETGRTHQLRVHLAAIGHPIAGDRTYGAPSRALKLSRQFLHAAKLEFTAPSGQKLSLESPLPEDLAAALQELESRI